MLLTKSKIAATVVVAFAVAAAHEPSPTKAEQPGTEGRRYAGLDDEGTAFEPQRNVIQAANGLDGGGSVAADDSGNVYVAWHAPEPGGKGEDNRRVWVARSTDEGKTFAREKPA